MRFLYGEWKPPALRALAAEVREALQATASDAERAATLQLMQMDAREEVLVHLHPRTDACFEEPLS